MNDDILDQRMLVLAAATAATVFDGAGYADALKHLPPSSGYRADNDVDTDVAIFNGFGTVS